MQKRRVSCNGTLNVCYQNKKAGTNNIISRVKESEMDTALQETINAIEAVITQ